MRRAMSLLGLALVGCGGAAPLVTAPPPARTELTAESAERTLYAETRPSASASPRPDGVWVHLSSPEALWRRLPQFAQTLPGLSLLSWTTNGEYLPRDVAAVVDMSQPVDVIWPLDGSFGTVWAFRARSPQAIQSGATGLTLRRIGPGTWDIGAVVAGPAEPEPDPDMEEEGEPDEDEDFPEDLPTIPELKCRLVHAAPPVGFRVLCVMPGPDDAGTLEAAFAFLLAPQRAAQATDLHVEVAGPSYAAFKARMGEIWDARSAFDPRANEGRRITGMLTDVGRALGQHEQATFDVSFAGDEARLALELAYPEPPLSAGFQTWLEQAGRAQLPSGTMLLPGDSGLALAFSGLGRDATTHLFSELAAEMDDDHVVDAKQLAELNAALAAVVPADAHFAMATGFDADAAMTSLSDDAVRIADDADRPLSAPAVKRLQASLGGWTVFGLDVAPEPYLAAVQRLYRLRNVKLPSKSGSTRPSPSVTDYRSAPAPHGLPKGTLAFVGQSRRARKLPDGVTSAPLDFDRHVVFVPDATRVWVVVSRSQSVAAARARELLEHRQPFAWRALDASAVLESSMELRALVGFALKWDTKDERAAAKASLARINQAPKSARLRIPLRLKVANGTGASGRRLRLESEVNLLDLLAQAVALAPLPSPNLGEE